MVTTDVIMMLERVGIIVIWGLYVGPYEGVLFST